MGIAEEQREFWAEMEKAGPTTVRAILESGLWGQGNGQGVDSWKWGMAKRFVVASEIRAHEARQQVEDSRRAAEVGMQQDALDNARRANWIAFGALFVAAVALLKSFGVF